MSVLDFKSDLSKYRAEVSVEEKNGPQTSVAKSSKAFATLQPITDKLLKNLPEIKKPQQQQSSYDKKLEQSKLDDIIRKDFDNMIINSVSEYSPTNIDTNTYNLGRQTLDKIISKFSDIKQEEIVTHLDKSNTLVLKSTSGKNNNESPIEVKQPNPMFDFSGTTPDIKKLEGNESDNIVIPEIKINGKPLTINREKQTVIINRTLFSPINNVVNPNIALSKEIKVSTKKIQTPDIVKDTIKEGLVMNPDTKIVKIQAGMNHFIDESDLNLGDRVARFNPMSKLVTKEPVLKAISSKYDGISAQLKDRSKFNIDTVSRTNPTGRNDDPTLSLYANNKNFIADFFGNQFFKGFSINQSQSDYNQKSKSSYGWSGNSANAPTTNFMSDSYAKGFKKFAKQNETEYSRDLSVFGFDTIRSVNFFDVKKEYAKQGFTPFARGLETSYINDVSNFTWVGKRKVAPSVDYFDIGKEKSTAGFHTFAQTLETKYKTSASIYDWDGKRERAPEVNYFDITKQHTKKGFHKFARNLDSKYKTESSIFDWDGKRAKAPSVNYFDAALTNTTVGFHNFAQLYDTKYKTESSIYDWDGVREDAPIVNYFDLGGKNTSIGFHSFAQIYDTKYVTWSSIFDWDGYRRNAPYVNYFDVSKTNTKEGFHNFAQLYDTKYVHESSIFDWDGNKQEAPVVNYFDLTGQNTSIGFHSFAQKYDTKYIPESSIYDWDGTKEQAPGVDYFDGPKRNTTIGFHIFAQHLDTKYIHGSSRFDWDGFRKDAPAVNYFDTPETNRTEFIGGFSSKTRAGFHAFARKYDTQYIPQSSEFDWDGTRDNAPTVNYFDTTLTNRTESEFPTGFISHTTAGFHAFAQKYDTKYVRNSSIYDWDGKPDRKNFKNPIPVDYFDNTAAVGRLFGKGLIINSRNDYRGGGLVVGTKDKFIAKTLGGFHIFAQLYETKYIPESSRFDGDGTREKAPAVDYFDTTKTNRSTSELINDLFVPKTTTGFHTFALRYDTKYIPDSSIYDWNGKSDRLNFKNPIPVDYFDNVGGFNKTFSDSLFIFSGANYFGGGLVVGSVDKFITKTTEGFHIFAQLYDTKYIPDASRFDWDGVPDRTGFANPLGVDYFDTAVGINEYRTRIGLPVLMTKTLKNFQKTTAGFHVFAQTYDTKYIHGSSRFDWDGGRQSAPAVDFFDNLSVSRVNDRISQLVSFRPKVGAKDGYVVKTHGFDTFIDTYDTRYIDAASRFDWDGNRNDAPAINYFDLQSTHTNVGFHKYAVRGDTKYIHALSVDTPTSEFGWGGNKQKAKTIDFFFNSSAKGFNSFSLEMITNYVNGISRFDWNGNRAAAPEVNYFGKLTPKTGYAKQLISAESLFSAIFGSNDGEMGFKNFFTNKNDTRYSALNTEFSTAARLDRFTNFFPAPNNYYWAGTSRLDSTDPSTLGLVTGLLTGIAGFIPYLGSLNRPVTDPSIAEVGLENYVNTAFVTDNQATIRNIAKKIFPGTTTVFDSAVIKRSSITTKTLGSKFSLVDSKRKTTRFFSWGKYPQGTDQGFFQNMTLMKGTLYPIIGPHINERGVKEVTPPIVIDIFAGLGDQDIRAGLGGLSGTGVFGGNFRDDPPVGNDTNLQVEHGRGNKHTLGRTLNAIGFGINDTFDGQQYLDVLLPNSLGKRPWSSAIGNNLFSSLQNQYPTYTHDATSRFYGYRRPNNSNVEGPSKELTATQQYLHREPGDYSIWRTARGGRYETQLRNGWWVQPSTDSADRGGTENQDPNLQVTGNFKIKDDSENLVRKYGNIGRWAIETGELDKQHSKFNLRADAHNTDLFWDQPYYVTNMGSHWGWGALACGRGSITTQLDRRFADLSRMFKFMTSGKGIMWNVVQFGLQATNPSVDSWSEPFDLFENRTFDKTGGSGDRINGTVSVTNTSLLGNFFGNDDGTGGIKSVLGNTNIFMPPPTQVYNPFSIFGNILGSGFLTRFQRHSTAAAYGMDGAGQWQSGYKQEIAKGVYEKGGDFTSFGGVNDVGNYFKRVDRTDTANPLATTADLKNLGLPTGRKGVPKDLNQHYEAQTTYRNKTGFINQNIAGLDYGPKTFHKTDASGKWEVPSLDPSQWNSTSKNPAAGADKYDAGLLDEKIGASSLNYFEDPKKDNQITRQRRYNRLIGLMKELLPQSFAPTMDPTRGVVPPYGPPAPPKPPSPASLVDQIAGFLPFKTRMIMPWEGITGRLNEGDYDASGINASDPRSSLRIKASTILLNVSNKRLSDSEIIRISSNFGGPHSFFGLFGTKFTKSSHKLLGPYTTSPVLDKDKVRDGKQRESFYSLDFYGSYRERLLEIRRKELTNFSGEVGGDLRSLVAGLALLRDGSTPLNPYAQGNTFLTDGRSTAIDKKYKKLLGEQITIQPITQMRLQANNPFEFKYPSSQDRLRNISGIDISRGSGMDSSNAFIPDASTAVAGLTPNRITNPILNPIKYHKTSDYAHLTKYKVSRPGAATNWNSSNFTGAGSLRSETFNDFRWDIEDLNGTEAGATPNSTPGWNDKLSLAFSPHPKIIDFQTQNLETKFGLSGAAGKPSVDRGNPRVTHIQYQKVQSAFPGGTLANGTTAVPANGIAFPTAAFPTRVATYPVPMPKIGSTSDSFRGDRINIIDYKRANFPITSNLVYETGPFNSTAGIPGAEDLVEFYFSSLVLDGHNFCPSEVIVFRATFDSITDNHKPTWNAVKYMGRGDPLYTYDGYERDVSFGFTVHIGSRDEMKASWRKLNYLAGFTAPEYTAAGFIRAPLCRLNIGNLFKKMPGYISSLSYTFDNQGGTWETAHLEGDRYNLSTDAAITTESRPGVLQLPKTIQVAVGFVPIGVYRPEKFGVFYPLYDDRNDGPNDVETGLIPQGTNRVNWFVPFDNIADPFAITNAAAITTATTATTAVAAVVAVAAVPATATTPAIAAVAAVPAIAAAGSTAAVFATGGDPDSTAYLAVRPGDENILAAAPALSPTEIP